MSVRRTALVTGASRGIGLAIAHRLAADGFGLTVSSRSVGSIDSAARELREHGGQVEAVSADMANEVAEGQGGMTATALSPGYVDTDMASWVHDRIDPATMISAGDIAELVACLTRLSRYAAIPNIPITRPGPQLWRA
jgi:NAD(P)-dependent dehydrogenase (short-subunit alcohol dehydrogenase family)